MKQASYLILSDTPDKMILSDVGPWDLHPTITNAAEDVIKELHQAGKLSGAKELLYYDSEGVLSRLRHDGQGNFLGFASSEEGK